MAWIDQEELRRELSVQVTGQNPPQPIRSFVHAGFEPKLLSAIAKEGFEAPTPIQSAALPVALSGRDMIGIAKTGSGKTLAFVWPMIVHVMDQRPVARGEGPIGLVLSPTRELAEQIFREAQRMTKPLGGKCVAIFGGAGKWEMVKALKEGPQIVVATPGRLIELIKSKATNLQRCTMVVLDEADRMFEMGFEYQMRSIVAQVRDDRQTMLFSATFKKRIEALANSILRNPIRITVGKVSLVGEC